MAAQTHDTIQVTLNAPVLTGGTFTAPYPSGLSRAAASYDAGGTPRLSTSQGADKSSGFTVAYGATDATVTWSAGYTLPQGTTVWVQLPLVKTDGDSGTQDLERVRLGDGALGVPALSFEADTDTGIYRTGANAMALVAGGAAAASVDSTGLQAALGQTTRAAGSFTVVNATIGSGTTPPLTADNGSTTAKIASFKDNATEVAFIGDGGDFNLVAAGSRVTFAQGQGANANFIADTAANNSLTYQVGRAGSGTDHIFRNTNLVMFRVNGSGLGAHLFEATATPAGGTAGMGYKIGAAGIGVFFGSGVPSLSAPQGSLYLRTDGTTTNDRAYINTNGTTGWTALTTAA